MESVGKRIRHLRKQKCLSQEELADEIGVTRQTISKWEKDLMSPNSDKIDNLCYVFGVKPEYFFLNYIESNENKEVAITEESTERKPENKSWIIVVVLLAVFAILSAILCAVVWCICFTPNKGYETITIPGHYNWIFYLGISLGMISLVVLITILVIKIKK